MNTKKTEINLPMDISIGDKQIVVPMNLTIDTNIKPKTNLIMDIIEKFFENILSVKVWTIFSLLGVTAYLCYYGKLSGNEFATINGSVITIVYGLREGFKVAKIRRLSQEEDIKKINA